MADARNARLPLHSFISCLGHGGMATLYLARHDRLGRLVAVKVIDDRFDDDPQFRQRVEREARTAAGLTHPNIVPVHEYGFTAEGRPFISMASIEGGSLRERLRERGRVPVDAALAINRRIAGALLVAHARHPAASGKQCEHRDGEARVAGDGGRMIDRSTTRAAPAADAAPWQLGASELARRIAARECTAEAALQSVLVRVAACNPALNAIVYPCHDAALERARAADAALSRGERWGPLHGVPVTFKENVDVRGMPTPNGVPGLERVIAPDDSPVVRNLLDAGAIVFGRTTAPEFSMRLTTESPLHGRTFNPWRPDASAGGSSGGAGAAAAAGMGPLHHGNDIGGSLRFPASVNGVCTVKPTLGRIPSFNPSATGERGLLAQLMSVQGFIAREVADVRLAMAVGARGDPRDPGGVPAPFEGEPISPPLRVAFTRNAHGYPMHPEIAAGVERAANLLAAAGYVVEEVEPPPITEPARGWMSIALAEMRLTLDPQIRRLGSDTIQLVFDGYYRFGDVANAEGYLLGLAARTRMTREWNKFLARYPLVLTPFLMRPAYPHDIDSRSYEGLADVFSAAIYSYGVNYLSLPAGVLPIGFVDGMPSAVQLVGGRYREDLILEAMAVLERDTGVLARQLWARDAASA